jgi:hypothetical protein
MPNEWGDAVSNEEERKVAYRKTEKEHDPRGKVTHDW